MRELKHVSKNMIFVKGGTFLMGGNSRLDDDEQPVHHVTVDDFYISKYEVTQAEWEKVMGDNPSNFKGDNRPVEEVSWYDAVEFCNKKSEMEGLEKCYSGSKYNRRSNFSGIRSNFSANGYRLPTEAEWEYAARGGNKSRDYRYSGSNDIDKVAWHSANAGGETHPVGTKLPNELGIYDMSGNVDEWCNDLYSPQYYSTSLSNNPIGPVRGLLRITRGGNYNSGSYSCRVANRSFSLPYYSIYLGFRILRANLD